jgi:acetolactate synthase-1/2/3 large subunit
VASGLPAVLHVEVDPELNADAIGYEQFQYARTL